jgi:hypothetical protein
VAGLQQQKQQNNGKYHAIQSWCATHELYHVQGTRWQACKATVEWQHHAIRL